MTIRYQVLGQPGRDNALLVTVDTGQAQHWLLFDCGADCLSEISISHVQQIEGVFFSHFHIDHIAGFDAFVRMNWDRAQSPVLLFGPLGARQILHHRLQGFTWNLVEGLPGEFRVTEIAADQTQTVRMFTCEGFAVAHGYEEPRAPGIVYRGDGFQVRACIMDHGLPCLAYVVREDKHVNVDLQALAALGLPPGSWLRTIKDPTTDANAEIQVGSARHRVAWLRERVLVSHPGDAIAYLTDFRLSHDEAERRLCDMLNGCRTIVCENNYRDADAELARRNYHMVSADVGRLAARIQPERLVLFHLSDRYTREEWQAQLREVQAVFVRTVFPEQWGLDEAR